MPESPPMSLPDAYEAFADHHRESSLLQSCASLLSWDQETHMPKGGAGNRAQQLTLLSGMVHRRQTSEEYGELLAAAEDCGLIADEHPAAAANLRVARRDYDRSRRIPPALVEEKTGATVLARRAWVDARANDDFPSFRPHLERIFDLSRQIAEAIGSESGDPYDALLDAYEPYATAEGIEAVFAPLREAHISLLDRILGSDRSVDVRMLHRDFPQRAQAALAREAGSAIGFDFERGRIDETAHPFCMAISPDDVRLTVRYERDFFNPAFFGLLHEAGHGMYAQGLPAKQHGLPAGTACSFGIHESQSRMWENLVGRSRSFWRWCYPKAQEAFPEALVNVAEEDFYRAINEVKPSLIRVEADEVTYNLHIMLRFELERALLSGELDAGDLPGAWNETFEKYLRISPDNDADGCLQDIHWSAGLIGYFPTYTLGNVYAAQIYEAAERDLGELEPQFERGEFKPLKEWLNRNIHDHGQIHPPRELVEVVTGSPPHHDALVRQLESKYLRS